MWDFRLRSSSLFDLSNSILPSSSHPARHLPSQNLFSPSLFLPPCPYTIAERLALHSDWAFFLCVLRVSFSCARVSKQRRELPSDSAATPDSSSTPFRGRSPLRLAPLAAAARACALGRTDSPVASVEQRSGAEPANGSACRRSRRLAASHRCG